MCIKYSDVCVLGTIPIYSCTHHSVLDKHPWAPKRSLLFRPAWVFTRVCTCKLHVLLLEQLHWSLEKYRHIPWSGHLCLSGLSFVNLQYMCAHTYAHNVTYMYPYSLTYSFSHSKRPLSAAAQWRWSRVGILLEWASPFLPTTPMELLPHSSLTRVQPLTCLSSRIWTGSVWQKLSMGGMDLSGFTIFGEERGVWFYLTPSNLLWGPPPRICIHPHLTRQLLPFERNPEIQCTCKSCLLLLYM